MELKEIQELIKMVKKADLFELKLKEGDFAITIKNKGNEQPTVYTTQAPAPVVQQAANTSSSNNEEAPASTNAAAPANENLITFRSPMVGTFYRKPGADKDPYVKVGDSVSSGNVLCIIEAMKLFNEIEFDGASGRIVKILAEDSSPVEYDQPLFLIEKAN
jgi:acetyl-CoA carboxylase biotin carboxyl carrier protein